MPAEEVSPVDKAGSGDREPVSRRRSGNPQLVPAVTFGLGVAALAGVVVTTGAVIPSAASARTGSGSAVTAVALDPPINLIAAGVTTCTGQS